MSYVLVRCLMPLLIVAGFSLELSAAARSAEGDIGGIVVRYREAPGDTRTGALSDRVLHAIAGAMQTEVTPAGRLSDGAIRLLLRSPLPAEVARERINRIRLDPSVVYANFDHTSARPATLKLAGAPSASATNRLIVKYADPVRTAAAMAGIALDQAELDRLSTLAGHPVAYVRAMHDGAVVVMLLQRQSIETVASMAAAIATQADVLFAQPDYIKTAQLTPTDPCYASASVAACNGNFQWDLFDPVGGVNATAAWDLTTGSSSVRIGVIDTGYLGGHPDLAGRFVGGYDFIDDQVDANDNDPVLAPCTPVGNFGCFGSRDANPADTGDWLTSADNAGTTFGGWLFQCGVSNSSFHGTHVSGTIGAMPNNGVGITGLNWVSLIVPARVLGKCGGYTSDIADAIVWESGGAVAGVPANANPVRVMNLSLGGRLAAGPPARQRHRDAERGDRRARQRRRRRGAAGNSNTDAANFSPASCNGVITVAATTNNGGRASTATSGRRSRSPLPAGANRNDSTVARRTRRR